MMAALDALHRLFSARSPAIAFGRGIGLAGVNAFAPARKMIARYAMGGA
jgi:ubiquinone biosynthesis monooxygenase Coq6|tara:strand:+ start:339 stop:485 length:147 start_codon:yes stop_codon:yes gene_type:complete